MRIRNLFSKYLNATEALTITFSIGNNYAYPNKLEDAS